MSALKANITQPESPPADSAHEWTYDKYAALDDDNRYEIIQGELIMAPSPSSHHQWTVGRLFNRFTQFVEKTQLGALFVAPLDVIFSQSNVLQPDIVFVAKDNFAAIEKKGIVKAPDLVVEVLSPSTMKRDRVTKKKLYAQFGVKEFWLVDMTHPSIEVLTLEEGHYETFSFEIGDGSVSSKLLEGFSLVVQDVIWDQKEA